PSLRGVVIDKKLFSRAIKDKQTKASEKPLLDKIDKEHNVETAALKAKLIDKLFALVNGRASQGVFNVMKEEVVPKSTKFTQKSLEKIDFSKLSTVATNLF